jgi:DNA mismatch repair protein MutL
MAGYQQNLRAGLFALSPRPSREQVINMRTAAAELAEFPSLTSAEPAAPPRLPSVAPPRPWPAGMEPEARTLMPDRPSFEPVPAHEYAGLTLIGQLFSLYLLCEKEGQFIVIDQHAAHERLLYGQLLQGYLTANIPQQALLFPAAVELTPAQAETLEQRGGEVLAFGLAGEPFGDATCLIKAAPALVSHVDPGALLREILDGLRGPVLSDGVRPVPQAVDDLLASMACKAAIKAGNRLQPVEMIKLLAQMEAGAVFSHCPHGRPALKTFTVQEVEQWFHRHGI